MCKQRNRRDRTEEDVSLPPPDRGVRLAWPDMPARVRGEIERWLGGAVVRAATQPTGFTPGVAARLTVDDGCRVFVKGAGPEPNPATPAMHRREASIVAALPPDVPVPRLLWSYDEGKEGWIVLVFEDVEGHHPVQPWGTDDLHRVIAAMEDLSTLLTPSPLSSATVGTAGYIFAERDWRRLRDEQPSRFDYLDEWSRRHMQTLVEIEETIEKALLGETLLHNDIRADNILLTPKDVWFVDWPHANVGPPWLDVVAFAPSVTMQGGPPPEEVISRHSATRTADSDAITAAVVALAGFFTHRAAQPPPPGLPTVRAFQDAQGVIARRWIAQRTGLS